MKTKILIILIFVSTAFLAFKDQDKPVTVYLIGDSTIANYSDNYDEGKDYMKTRYPKTGWGQVFSAVFCFR